MVKCLEMVYKKAINAINVDESDSEDNKDDPKKQLCGKRKTKVLMKEVLLHEKELKILQSKLQMNYYNK